VSVEHVFGNFICSNSEMGFVFGLKFRNVTVLSVVFKIFMNISLFSFSFNIALAVKTPGITSSVISTLSFSILGVIFIL
jgi:hypothetical protein